MTPAPRPDAWWRARHRELNERARAGPYDLVFVGDSITQGWLEEGRPIWDKVYAPRRALNLGLSGDRTEHVLWRLRNGNLAGLDPRVVVLLVGTNNAPLDGARTIASGISAIVRTLRARLPRARVLLLGIFPRGARPNSLRARCAAANELAARAADGKHVHYLDLGHRFLAADETLPQSVSPDELHLSEEGYRIWAEAMKPKLTELLAEKH